MQQQQQEQLGFAAARLPPADAAASRKHVCANMSTALSASSRRRRAAASEQHKQRQQLGLINQRMAAVSRTKATADRHTHQAPPLGSHLLDLCLDLIVVLGRLQQEQRKSQGSNNDTHGQNHASGLSLQTALPCASWPESCSVFPSTAVLCCSLCRRCFGLISWQLQGNFLLCDVASSRHSAAALTRQAPAAAAAPHTGMCSLGRHHCRGRNTHMTPQLPCSGPLANRAATARRTHRAVSHLFAHVQGLFVGLIVWLLQHTQTTHTHTMRCHTDAQARHLQRASGCRMRSCCTRLQHACLTTCLLRQPGRSVPLSRGIELRLRACADCMLLLLQQLCCCCVAAVLLLCAAGACVCCSGSHAPCTA